MANIDTTIQLNKLIAEQNKMFSVQSQMMKGQLATMKAMVATLGKLPADKVAQSFEEMEKAIKDADEAVNEFGSNSQAAMGDVSKAAEEGAEKTATFTERIEKLAEKSMVFATIATSLGGFIGGLKLSVSVMQSLVSVATTLASTLFDVGVAIITAPFKMLNALMDYAAQGGGSGLREAIRQVRIEFGDLTKYEGRDVMKAFRNIRGELAETGLSSWRILGNMGERLDFVRDSAKALGSLFSSFRKEIVKNVERWAAYVKGLGLSEEGQKNLAKSAKALGKPITEVGKDIAKMALGMAKSFGLSNKLISRDISEMIGDFENFGSVGIKEMSQIAVYTRKLGIEIKDLLGVIGQFDDFEQAAKSAAQLSQAFGMQVDALQMLKAEDPAQRFEMLRKSFAATGRSIENLTRQERKLLSEQTGLTQDALKLGFANKSLNYEDVQKQAGITEKKTLTQAEAMEKLSDSIEGLVKPGGQLKGGFFDIFLAGMGKGIERSREFRGVIWRLSRAMRTTDRAGRQVGRAFVELFPGLKQILDGFKAFFDPAIFGKWTRTKGVEGGLMGEVVKHFRKFFDDMKGGKGSLEDLFTKLQKSFLNYFNKSTPEGRKMLDGFKKTFKAISNIFAQGLEMAMKGVTKGIDWLIDLVKGEKKIKVPATNAFVKFFEEVFAPVYKVIEKQGPILWKAIKDLFKAVWEKAKPYVAKGISLTLEYAFYAAVTMASINAAVASIGMLLVKGAGAVAKGAGGFITKAGGLLATGLEKIFLKAQATTTAAQVAGKPTGLFGRLKDMMSGTKKMAPEVATGAQTVKKFNFVKLAKQIGVGLLAVTAIVAAMAGTFWLINKAIGNISKEQATKITGILIDMSKIFIMAGVAVVEMAAIGGGILFTGGLAGIAFAAGLGVVATIIEAMAIQTIAIMKSIDKFQPKPGFKAKVNAFISVLTGIGSFAKTILGIIEVAQPSFRDLKSLFPGSDPEKQFQDNLGMIQGIIEAIGEQVKNIIDSIALAISGFSEQELKAGAVLGDMLSGVASLIKALQPPPEVVKEKGWGALLFGSTKAEDIGAAGKYIAGVMPHIEKLVDTMTGALKKVKEIEITEEGAKSIKVFGTLLMAVGKFLKALAPSQGLASLLSEAAADDKGVNRISGLIVQHMQKVTESLSRLVLPIRSFVNEAKKIASKVGDAKTVELAKDYIWTLSKAMMGMVGPHGAFSKKRLDQLDEAEFGKIPGTFIRMRTEFLKPLETVIIPFTDQVEQNVNLLKEVYVGQLVSGVRDTVAEINNIAAELNKLNAIDIRTQLRRTSDSLGLKGTEELKIKMKDFSVNVNVEVKIDTKDLETVLTKRPGNKFATT